jgi:hypothetical protein
MASGRRSSGGGAIALLADVLALTTALGASRVAES